MKNRSTIEASEIASFDVLPKQQIILCEGLPDSVGKAHEAIAVLCAANISVDLIVHNLPSEDAVSLGITTEEGALGARRSEILASLRGICQRARLLTGYTKLSIAGWLLQGKEGVLQDVLHELAGAAIHPAMISVSGASLEFLVEDSSAVEAVEMIQEVIRKTEQSD